MKLLIVLLFVSMFSSCYCGPYYQRPMRPYYGRPPMMRGFHERVYRGGYHHCHRGYHHGRGGYRNGH